MDWNDVEAAALRLPGTERSTSYGKPAIKVRKKAIAAWGHEPDEAFCLMLPIEEIEHLIEAEPKIFYQTPHYQGWPAVLVRYATVGDRLGPVLERAWRHRAPAAMRNAFPLSEG